MTDAPQGESAPRLAVIGAGPAGLAATLAAARRGLRVTLVDAAPEPSITSCTWLPGITLKDGGAN
ncbi:FAD-dependent oxidoreductase, partial [Streptomyces sp. NPDC002172]